MSTFSAQDDVWLLQKLTEKNIKYDAKGTRDDWQPICEEFTKQRNPTFECNLNTLVRHVHSLRKAKGSADFFTNCKNDEDKKNKNKAFANYIVKTESSFDLSAEDRALLTESKNAKKKAAAAAAAAGATTPTPTVTTSAQDKKGDKNPEATKQQPQQKDAGKEKEAKEAKAKAAEEAKEAKAKAAEEKAKAAEDKAKIAAEKAKAAEEAKGAKAKAIEAKEAKAKAAEDEKKSRLEDLAKGLFGSQEVDPADVKATSAAINKKDLDLQRQREREAEKEKEEAEKQKRKEAKEAEKQLKEAEKAKEKAEKEQKAALKAAEKVAEKAKEKTEKPAKKQRTAEDTVSLEEFNKVKEELVSLKLLFVDFQADVAALKQQFAGSQESTQKRKNPPQ